MYRKEAPDKEWALLSLFEDTAILVPRHHQLPLLRFFRKSPEPRLLVCYMVTKDSLKLSYWRLRAYPL